MGNPEAQLARGPSERARGTGIMTGPTIKIGIPCKRHPEGNPSTPRVHTWVYATRGVAGPGHGFDRALAQSGEVGVINPGQSALLLAFIPLMEQKDPLS